MNPMRLCAARSALTTVQLFHRLSRRSWSTSSVERHACADTADTAVVKKHITTCLENSPRADDYVGSLPVANDTFREESPLPRMRLRNAQSPTEQCTKVFYARAYSQISPSSVAVHVPLVFLRERQWSQPSCLTFTQSCAT